MVFRKPFFKVTVKIRTRLCYKRRFMFFFQKLIFWVKNGICLDDHARNLIKLNLEPKLSQFVCLFKIVFTDGFRDFQQAHIKYPCGEFTIQSVIAAKKQSSLIVNDSITASFLFLLLMVNHLVSTELFKKGCCQLQPKVCARSTA